MVRIGPLNNESGGRSRVERARQKSLFLLEAGGASDDGGVDLPELCLGPKKQTGIAEAVDEAGHALSVLNDLKDRVFGEQILACAGRVFPRPDSTPRRAHVKGA